MNLSRFALSVIFLFYRRRFMMLSELNTRLCELIHSHEYCYWNIKAIDRRCCVMSALCAHPVAAVPFARYGLPLSALIIGSMIPDGVYFLPFLPVSEQFGHTPTGLIGFCLPAGVVMYWLYHTLFKYPAYTLLPRSHQVRLWSVASRSPERSFRHWLLVIIALGIGAVTHIAWDSCTHWYGWTAQHLALLRLPLLHTASGTLRVYKVLQHGGTLVGTGILVWWYLAWLHNTPSAPVPERYMVSTQSKCFLWLIVLGGAGAGGMVASYMLVFPIHTLDSFSTFVVLGAKISMGIIFVGLLFVSIGWHIAQYHRKHAQKTAIP